MESNDQAVPVVDIAANRWHSVHTVSLHISEKEFVYATGRSFRGLTVSQGAGGTWNVVVRAWKGDEPQYAMVVADAPAAGMQLLMELLSNGSGDSLWRFDRYTRSP